MEFDMKKFVITMLIFFLSGCAYYQGMTEKTEPAPKEKAKNETQVDETPAPNPLPNQPSSPAAEGAQMISPLTQ